MEHNWEDYFDTSTEYWLKTQKIYEENEHFPKIVVKNRNLHHKFPRSFSKKDGVEIDNDEDNLVSLSLANHFRVHYYLWKCCKKGYRGMMALAFQFMRKKAIKYASDKTIEELAKDYENVMKDVTEHQSEALKGNQNAKGHRVSKEARRKMSKVKECNKNAKGYHHTEEAKRKMSEAGKGNQNAKGKRSEEVRKRMAEAHKGTCIGKDNHFYGKTHSEEAKKKIREAHKGKHWKLVDGKRVWY